MTPSLTELAAALAPHPRGAWPAEVRARFPDDPALAAQVLMWLTASDAAGPADAELPDLGAGGDRYELGELLDRGASGAVWQARDHTLGRDVAIKVFHDDRSPAVEQSLAEARAASEVNSEHVVRVLDVHAHAPPYLVMELVGEHDPRTGAFAPGASAAAVRPASLEEAVRWARDVARGVHDAHLRNVFHRDLKPHNVLVAPHSRRAKIADFGLAVRAAASPALGASAGIAGTPAYMAPEQARGLPLALDPDVPTDRAILVGLDVWGIGAIAYALLAGRPPWEVRGDLEPWECAAAGEAPAPLVAMFDGRPIPRRLRRVIARALALVPGERYATALDLAADLDAFLARRPTSLDRAGSVRLGLWIARNPQLAVAGLVAVVLASLSLVAYGTIREVRTQRNELAAEIAEARTINDTLAQRAEHARRELTATEATLRSQGEALVALEQSRARATQEYQDIVDAKQRALQDADAATRELVTRLTAMRQERDAAQLVRSLTETFLARARTETAQAERELEQAAHERDLARVERDQLERERDTARLARTQAEDERDHAREERDRAEALRRRVEIDLARVAAQLAAAIGRGSPSVDAGAAEVIAPPPAGAADDDVTPAS